MAKRGTPKKASEFDRLESVIEIMNRHQLEELEWERQGERIRLKAARGPALSQAPFQVPRKEALAVEKTTPAQASKQILSPFVGTFYRSSRPGGEPYCREGQVVKRGDPLCIIEAMKLMNEIESEYNGKIVSILVENGQPVEFGEPLFLIEVKG